MTDDQLLRYSRHILLNEIGIEGQERISNGHALVIGAGGLGSPVALYLGSAGVGHITLVDDDTVDLTNLQRQIAHTTVRVGEPKVTSAQAAIAAINPDVVVSTIQTRADAELLEQQHDQPDGNERTGVDAKQQPKPRVGRPSRCREAHKVTTSVAT